MEIFSQILTAEILEHISFQTNLYATQAGKPFKPTNTAEIGAFIGLNFLMGIKPQPSYRDYWSTKPELHDAYISRIMSVKRFGWLLSNIHLNDTMLMPDRNSTKYDKLYKLRPFFEMIGDRFEKCFAPSEYLAVDESMIKCKGRSSLKQYMPKKPIKRGYKVWMLCDKSAYICKFEIYTGKKRTLNQK